MTALSHGIAFFFVLDTTTSCINWVLVFTCDSCQYCFAYTSILPLSAELPSVKGVFIEPAIPSIEPCPRISSVVDVSVAPVSAPSTDWHGD